MRAGHRGSSPAEQFFRRRLGALNERRRWGKFKGPVGLPEGPRPDVLPPVHFGLLADSLTTFATDLPLSVLSGFYPALVVPVRVEEGESSCFVYRKEKEISNLIMDDIGAASRLKGRSMREGIRQKTSVAVIIELMGETITEES